MECTVSWTAAAGTRSGMGFVAETGSGHVLVMDGAPDAANPANGGQNLAPRPMETVLAGTGGCTAYDVVLTDHAMPEMDGVSFIKAVRSEPAYGGVRLVVITTELEVGRVAEALDASATCSVIADVPG